ncbi:hypothetical protein D3C80_1779620 [compost metagenome]
MGIALASGQTIVMTSPAPASLPPIMGTNVTDISRVTPNANIPVARALSVIIRKSIIDLLVPFDPGLTMPQF